ncbi:MAG TPA: hypothetical protein VGH19_18455 [Verrucomicrobiae bacterium]
MNKFQKPQFCCYFLGEIEPTVEVEGMKQVKGIEPAIALREISQPFVAKNFMKY